MWVGSLVWEDALKKGMTTCSILLAWRIPMDSSDGQAPVHGVAKTRTQLSTHTCMHIKKWSIDC